MISEGRSILKQEGQLRIKGFMIQRTQVTKDSILEFISVRLCKCFHRTFNSSYSMFVEQGLKFRTDIAARVCRHAKLVLMTLLEFVQGFYKSVMLFHCQYCRQKTYGSLNILILSDSIRYLHGVIIIIYYSSVLFFKYRINLFSKSAL